MKIKKPLEPKNPVGVLHSFSIKNIFYDKMDLKLFCFHVTISNLDVETNTQ